MEKNNWNYIKKFIETTLFNVQDKLNKETIDTVKHYIDHNEYEMAFEGLFLEVMSLDVNVQIDLFKCREIGILLKLHEESIFDFEFWGKFENYLKSRN